MTEKILVGLATLCGGQTLPTVACTGISLTAKDGSYVQARTIEWAKEPMQSMYTVIPRGEILTSFTPKGDNGMTFAARYGVIGLCVVMKEFIAEGINEAGLSAGLFFFPNYGSYQGYVESLNKQTLADLRDSGKNETKSDGINNFSSLFCSITNTSFIFVSPKIISSLTSSE